MFDFKQEADRLVTISGMFETVDIDGILHMVEHAHTIGPLLDPTRYRDALDRGVLDKVAELARAAKRVVAIHEEMREKAGL